MCERERERERVGGRAGTGHVTRYLKAVQRPQFRKVSRKTVIIM